MQDCLSSTGLGVPIKIFSCSQSTRASFYLDRGLVPILRELLSEEVLRNLSGQVVVNKLLEVGLAKVLGLVLALHGLVLVDVTVLHL